MTNLYSDEKKYKDNSVRNNFIFLGYPYNPPFSKEDYRKAIKELEAEIPIRFWYFLDEVTSSELMRKIWRAILRSDISFFDISGGNPNVAFELGLALATDKKAFALLKTNSDNPLGKADLGYAERLEYNSIIELKDKIKSTVFSKSNAFKIFKDTAYETFDSSYQITKDDYTNYIIAIVNRVFNHKSINRNQARGLVNSNDRIAYDILQALRAKGVFEMTGAKKHAKYIFTSDWIYKDHEVSGD